MNVRIVAGVAALALGLASAAGAQTRFSVTSQCAKDEKSFAIPVTDDPAHVYAINQGTCMLSGDTMAGLSFKQQLVTSFADAKGPKSTDHGNVVVMMANGDKAFVTFTGTSMMQGPVRMGGEGTWRFTGGTGKLKGLKGQGTYTSTGKPDGTSNDRIDGDWMLPAAKPAK